MEGDEVSQESVLMEKEGQRRYKKTRAEATSTRTLGGPTALSFLWTQELSCYYSKGQQFCC